jgi:DNA-binding Xre family transcriptional regulator
MSWEDHDTDLIREKLKDSRSKEKRCINASKDIEFNSYELKKDLITKRQIDNNWSMDEACKQIGISKATLSRLEKGKLPDIETFMKVCKWLNALPNKYFTPEKLIR